MSNNESFNTLLEAERQHRREHISENFDEIMAESRSGSEFAGLKSGIRSIIMAPIVVMNGLRYVWLWALVAVPVSGLIYWSLYINDKV